MKWLVALGVGLASTAWAAGGTIKGTITGPDGRPVTNATVLVEGPPAPSTSSAPHAVVEQRDQTFVPHVLVVASGTTVDFPNHDPMLHNVYSASPAKKFDLGMYEQGVIRSVTFDTPGVVRIGCNVHPKMEAFVVVHPNPYGAVTNDQGVYTIVGVPTGSWQVRVWDERLAERRAPIVVREGEVQPLDLRLETAR
jgi:plastocyanin